MKKIQTSNELEHIFEINDNDILTINPDKFRIASLNCWKNDEDYEYKTIIILCSKNVTNEELDEKIND